MLKIFTVALVVFTAGILTVPAPAFACSETVKQAMEYLKKTRQKAASAKSKEKYHKVDRWLKESAAALRDAKADCDKAEGFLERRAIATRVLGIQTKIATADALIEGESGKKEGGKSG